MDELEITMHEIKMTRIVTTFLACLVLFDVYLSVFYGLKVGFWQGLIFLFALVVVDILLVVLTLTFLTIRKARKNGSKR